MDGEDELPFVEAMEDKMEHLTKTADNMGYALYIMRESQKKEEEERGSQAEAGPSDHT